MSKVFIAGSRQIPHLSAEARDRLIKIIDSGFEVIVGDANGIDKAVQKFMADSAYDKVTVFCSGDKPRNNVGHWKLHSVAVPRGTKGFQFYAAKDREMASIADFGLMIWDGKSVGTVLNILRMLREHKKAVLINVFEKNTSTFKTKSDWLEFLSRCDAQFVSDLRERATPKEWALEIDNNASKSLTGKPEESQPQLRFPADGSDFASDINAAFSTGDMGVIINILSSSAKARGMSAIAKESGLSRESLYRSLSANGNPEFLTILKVLESLGLRLSVIKKNEDQVTSTRRSASDTLSTVPS